MNITVELNNIYENLNTIKNDCNTALESKGIAPVETLFEMAEGIEQISGGDNNNNNNELVKQLLERSLTEITIPDDVTILGRYSLAENRNLTKIELLSNVNAIDNYACSNCSSLQEIDFPKNINIIGTGAFRSCTSLKTAVFRGTPIIRDGVFTGCTSLTDIYVPWAYGENGDTQWGAENASVHYNTKEVTILDIIEAAKRELKFYIEGKAFPEQIRVGNSKVNQQGYYLMAAQAIQDIYNFGKEQDISYLDSYYNRFSKPDTVASYTIKMADGNEATIASKAFYMNYAIRQTKFITTGEGSTDLRAGASALYPTNNANANGFAVSDYTGQMTYEAALLMFTRVLAAYGTNGILPESVSLNYVPNYNVYDGQISTLELIRTATEAVESYQYATPFGRDGFVIGGDEISQPSYYILCAEAIQDIYNGNTNVTYEYKTYNVPNLEADYTIKMTDGSKASTASKNLYMNFAIRQTVYANGAGAGTCGASASYPTSESNANGFPAEDYSGLLTYEAGLLMMSRVLKAYGENDILPESVELQWVPARDQT